MEKRITAKEAAAYLGIHPARFFKVKKYIGSTRLPIDRNPKYTHSELDAFIARCYEPPIPITENEPEDINPRNAINEEICLKDTDIRSKITNPHTGTRTSRLEEDEFEYQLDKVLGT